MEARPPQQAAILRQHAQSVGGVDEFMRQYDQLKEKYGGKTASLTQQETITIADGSRPVGQFEVPVTTKKQLVEPKTITSQMMLDEIKLDDPQALFMERLAAGDFIRKGPAKSLNELVEEATGVKPQAVVSTSTELKVPDAPEVPSGPAFNTFYPQKKGLDYGYQFLDAETVQFLQKGGKKKSKIFKKGDPDYDKAMKEAQQAYQISLGK